VPTTPQSEKGSKENKGGVPIFSADPFVCGQRLTRGDYTVARLTKKKPGRNTRSPLEGQIVDLRTATETGIAADGKKKEHVGQLEGNKGFPDNL